MTDTKPSLDEQIKYQTEEAALANASEKLPHRWSAHSNAILASLEELKRIKELMLEPNEEMQYVGDSYIDMEFSAKVVFTTMSAVLLEQVEKEIKE